MHRIKRPTEPAAFLEYRKQNPTERNWDTFNSTAAYRETRKTLYHNQGGLCAYCEKSIPYGYERQNEYGLLDEHGKTQVKVPKPGHARIEHFHAKADSDPNHNWMLDWNNLMMVCMAGGEGESRHCDARKEDVQNRNVLVDGVPAGYVFEGYILNPYEMPNECLFRLEEKDGSLHADDVVCGRFAVQGNKHPTTAILVDRTIDVLNLNSKDLCRQRKAVQEEYEQKRKSLRQKATQEKRSVRELVAEEWFGDNRTPSFFTTRRCLLKGQADPYITTGIH